MKTKLLIDVTNHAVLVSFYSYFEANITVLLTARNICCADCARVSVAAASLCIYDL